MIVYNTHLDQLIATCSEIRSSRLIKSKVDDFLDFNGADNRDLILQLMERIEEDEQLIIDEELWTKEISNFKEEPEPLNLRYMYSYLISKAEKKYMGMGVYDDRCETNSGPAHNTMLTHTSPTHGRLSTASENVDASHWQYSPDRLLKSSLTGVQLTQLRIWLEGKNFISPTENDLFLKVFSGQYGKTEDRIEWQLQHAGRYNIKALVVLVEAICPDEFRSKKGTLIKIATSFRLNKVRIKPTRIIRAYDRRHRGKKLDENTQEMLDFIGSMEVCKEG